MLILIIAAVFAASTALDYAAIKNKIAIQNRDTHSAARWAIAMYLIGLIGLFGVIEYSWWLAVPECAGVYLGTWLALRDSKENDFPRAQILQSSDRTARFTANGTSL